MQVPPEVLPEIQKRSAQVDRLDRWERYLKLALAGLAIILMVVLLGENASLRNKQDQVFCTAKVNSKFDAAVARAFLSPPAPNPERSAAVASINQAAHTLANIEKVCN